MILGIGTDLVDIRRIERTIRTPQTAGQEREARRVKSFAGQARHQGAQPRARETRITVGGIIHIG